MAGPGTVKQATASLPPTEGLPARTAVGTGCADKTRDPLLARAEAGLKARADALRKVCGGEKQAGSVSGTMSGGIERYFVDDASGQLCATGTFQVVCEPALPASPAPLRQATLSEAERATTAVPQRIDISATERELEEVAREAQRDIADIRRGKTSLDDIRERAERAFDEMDKL